LAQAGEDVTVRVAQEALIIPHDSLLLDWTTSDYLVSCKVHTFLANFDTNIATAKKEAIDLINIMSCRGVIESVNVIAGCVGGK
jgi:hypothetical protein